jgi:hypothetical protein
MQVFTDVSSLKPVTLFNTTLLILSIGFILGSLLIIIIAGVTLDNSEDTLSVILSLKDQ